ncbi:MAG: fibronectin type III-like domain-contianing protein, partial [Clostridia bacterium]|nr:fibronectin type III-like domain-contianing protein [Clostridia bacterium]
QEVTFNVTNTGDTDGDEVVQLYVNDRECSVVIAERLLRKFKRISLRAGETEKVTFILDYDDFKLYGLDNKWKVEPGEFNILIGASASDIRIQKMITIK